MSAAGAVAWGVMMRPLLAARDAVVVAGNAEVRRAWLALRALERRLPPHTPSGAGVAAAAARALPSSSLTWGETPIATARALLARAGVDARSTVVDLGAGRGSVLLAARLLGAQARGVELDPMRAEPAVDALARAGAALTVGDARELPLDGATHVWLAWTCMPDDVRAALADRLRALPAGARAIALTWAPPRDAFAILAEEQAAFSWGRATAILAERRR